MRTNHSPRKEAPMIELMFVSIALIDLFWWLKK